LGGQGTSTAQGSLTNAYPRSIVGAHEAPLVMGIPLILLGIGSIFVGYLAKDMMIGLGTNFWGNALFNLPENALLIESEYIPQFIKYIPLMFGILGCFFAYMINISKISHLYNVYYFKTSKIGKSLYLFLNKRWLFDKVYNDYIVSPSLSFGYSVSFKTLDKGIIEILGPYGIVKTFQSLSYMVSKIQSGYIYHYAFAMLISLSFFIALTGLWDFFSYWIDNRLYFIYLISFFFYNAASGVAPEGDEVAGDQ
jgi:NADH-ubiquinone oxidoreductase chain 5